MQRLAVAVALLLVPAAAAGDRDFFPVRVGAEWTFEDLQYGGTQTVSVRRVRAGVFRLVGFPGASSLRVRWSGETLQAWDGRDRRWEAFLRLGARAGTAYAVDLPQPLWADARVTVASRRASFFNPVLRRRHAGLVRLAVRPSPELADAGITGLWFERRVGLVRWAEQTIAGPTVHVLS